MSKVFVFDVQSSIVLEPLCLPPQEKWVIRKKSHVRWNYFIIFDEN